MNIQLRRIAEEDCRRLWEWANDPQVRAASFTTDPIPWETHVRWFESKLRDPNCSFFIALDESETAVGQVRFDVKHAEANIDVSVDRLRRGAGYGTLLIRQAADEMFRSTPISAIHAFIKPENQSSIRAFEKARFHQVEAGHYVCLKDSAADCRADQKKQIRVLLTGAGGAGTIEIIHALRQTGRYRITAVDASPHAIGLKLADRGYVVPMANSPEFEESMEWILEQESPEYAIPLVDEEILFFHAMAARFQMKVVAPVEEFCRLSLDKWLTYQSLHYAGIPVPETQLASTTDSISFPAVIKPRKGRGSRGLAYLMNTGEFKQYMRTPGRMPDDFIIQRKVEGREFTVSVVVGLDGQILAVVPKEVLTKRGITFVGATREAPEIDLLCRKIQNKLRANGPFNVQLIRENDGAPYVIEINPRYSTTTALTIAAGVNEVDDVIRHAEGESLEPPNFRRDFLMIRYHTQLYLPESDWPPAGVSRTLETAGRPPV